MAGFLKGVSNLLIPFGQTAGVSMQRQQVSDDLEKQNQANQAGFNEILAAGGPEMDIWRKASAAGMSRQAIAAAAGGPFGQQLQAAHARERWNEIFQNPEDLQDPAKVWKARGEGLLSSEEALKYLQPQAKGAFEGWLQDVQHISPAQARALPVPEMERLAAKFKDWSRKASEPPMGAEGGTYVRGADPGFDKWVDTFPGAKNMPYKEAYKMYGQMAKPGTAEMGSMEMAQTASTELEGLLKSSEKVLPAKEGFVGAQIGRLGRYYKFEAGNADVTDFEANKPAIIEHLRAVANATRINVTELNMASNALQNARSYPAMVKAIRTAQARLKEVQDVLRTRRQFPDYGPAPGAPAGNEEAPDPGADILENSMDPER